MIRTYTIRLFPTIEQIAEIENLAYVRNSLWNYLIGLEQESYEETGSIMYNYVLDGKIVPIKKEMGFDILNSKACQRISQEIFFSYRSFFNLLKKDKTAKPPQKNNMVESFHTIVYNQSGWIFKPNNIVVLNKIPLSYKSNPILGNLKDLNIKETRLKFKNGKYLLDICVEYADIIPETLTHKNKVLAIDLGIKNLGTGIDTDGNMIIIKNRSAKINKYFSTQINKVKSKLSKKEKYSRSYEKLNRIKINLYNSLL